MMPGCVSYASVVMIVLLYPKPSSSSSLGRIIGHPYHTPPWSNEANLNANIKAMQERRRKEREKFDREHAEVLKQHVAITVTESPEQSEINAGLPDTREIDMCYHHRQHLANMYDAMDEHKQVRKQRLEKNITGGNVLIENFYYGPDNQFVNTFTFTTTSTTPTPTTSTASTLIYTFRYGFVFEEIVGLISTTPTPIRHPKPPSTEIYPWELWYPNVTWGSQEIKKLWQINRYTPFLVHFTDSDYQSLSTTPACMSFNVSWEYSDDPCDVKKPLAERNQTTLPTTYDSNYLCG